MGFYSTGPKIKPADLDIADLVSNYCKQPVFALIDIRAHREEEGLPVKAYSTVEKVRFFLRLFFYFRRMFVWRRICFLVHGEEMLLFPALLF